MELREIFDGDDEYELGSPVKGDPDDPIVYGNRWRRERDQARAERDKWVKLWNRLEAAISHHKKAKLTGVDTSDEVDEALWAARDKILSAASEASK